MRLGEYYLFKITFTITLSRYYNLFLSHTKEFLHVVEFLNFVINKYFKSYV